MAGLWHCFPMFSPHGLPDYHETLLFLCDSYVIPMIPRVFFSPDSLNRSVAAHLTQDFHSSQLWHFLQLFPKRGLWYLADLPGPLDHWTDEKSGPKKGKKPWQFPFRPRLNLSLSRQPQCLHSWTCRRLEASFEAVVRFGVVIGWPPRIPKRKNIGLIDMGILMVYYSILIVINGWYIPINHH